MVGRLSTLCCEKATKRGYLPGFKRPKTHLEIAVQTYTAPPARNTAAAVGAPMHSERSESPAMERAEAPGMQRREAAAGVEPASHGDMSGCTACKAVPGFTGSALINAKV